MVFRPISLIGPVKMMVLPALPKRRTGTKVVELCIGNRYNGRFRSNDLALGKGITNRVQLNTGIGMDIGIQIVRRSGSVDNRSVMTDNRDTADADAGIQLSIQIIHGVNIRAKATALCITIAVNIQLVDGGINVDVMD